MISLRPRSGPMPKVNTGKLCEKHRTKPLITRGGRWQPSKEIPLVTLPLLHYINVSKELAVVYLPVNSLDSKEAGTVPTGTVGIALQTIPLKGGNHRPCIILPIDGDHLRRTNGCRSLRGRCACLLCLKKACRQAKEENKDIISHIHEQMNMSIFVGIREVPDAFSNEQKTSKRK